MHYNFGTVFVIKLYNTHIPKGNKKATTINN